MYFRVKSALKNNSHYSQTTSRSLEQLLDESSMFNTFLAPTQIWILVDLSLAKSITFSSHLSITTLSNTISTTIGADPEAFLDPCLLVEPRVSCTPLSCLLGESPLKKVCYLPKTHTLKFTITAASHLHLLSVFDSVVTGAFQITFHTKMHVNNVFLFFKNYF